MQAGRTEGKGGRTEGDAGRVVMEVSRPEPFPGRASIQVASESGGAGGVGYRGRDRLPSFHFKFAVSETSRSPSHGFQVAARVLSASGAGFADRRISAALAGVALAGAAARLRRVFGRRLCGSARPRRPGAIVSRPDSARSERGGGNRRQATESGKSKGEGAQGWFGMCMILVGGRWLILAQEKLTNTLPTPVAPSSSSPLTMAVCSSVALQDLPVLYAEWAWRGVRIPTQ